MVKRQEVEQKRSRIVELILGVVALQSERARPLAKIEGQAGGHGEDVSAVRLKDIAVHIGTQFIGWVALQGRRGLAELQIETCAVTLVDVEIRRALQYDVGLIQAEAIAAHVI